MIYLIHIEPPYNKAAHYLGFCANERLSERLKEHARGRGAKLAANAIKAGRKLYLARTFPDGDRQLETKMKSASHFKQLCPFCCEMLRGMMSETYLIDADRPDQPPQAAITGWPQPNNWIGEPIHDRPTPNAHMEAALTYARKSQLEQS
jgi:hypothetical protein